jgi:phospholipase C
VIFVSWDDWGGFYDHSLPPVIDQNGYGLRVPGLVISPYVKAHTLDHQILSHDAYVKFIEDRFLSSQRLDPLTDGRPDPRPSVRESLLHGDLLNDFDFAQTPLAPLVLEECPYDGGCLCPLDGGTCTGTLIP